MKKLFFVLLLWSAGAYSQSTEGVNKPGFISPSPKAASMAVYGTSNIPLSSGSMAMQIPLVHLTEGGIPFNLAVDYLFNGYKPSDHSKMLGMGFGLKVGGFITRTVNGAMDESPEGFLYQGGDYSEAMPTNQQNSDLSSDLRDGQPDNMVYNFMDYSGRFSFGNDGLIHFSEQTPLKIRYEPINPVPGYVLIPNRDMGRFIITDPAGVTYIFDNVEASRSYATASPSADQHVNNVITTWYLSRVIGTNGETLEFTYTAMPAVYPSLTESASQKLVILDPFQPHNQGLIYVRNKTFELYPESVKASLWTLRFHYSDRSLTLGTNTHSRFKSLDAVSLYDSTASQELKRFEFTYTDDTRRHLLRSVQEKGGTESLPPHVFEYFNENQSYPADVRSIDRRGYFNGEYNTTLAEHQGARRKPDFINARSFALRKITYPTGGETTITYEPNNYSYLAGYPHYEEETIQKSYAFTWQWVGGSWQILHSDTIQIDTATTHSYFIDSENPIEDSLHCRPRFDIPLGARATPYTAADFLPHPSCRVLLAEENNTQFGVMVTVKEKIRRGHGGKPGYTTIEAGGVRVNSITNTSGQTGSELTSYLYQNMAQVQYSSGSILATSPDWVELSGNFGTGRLYKSEAFNPMAAAPVFYEEVMEHRNGEPFRHHFFSAFGGEKQGGRDDPGEIIPSFWYDTDFSILPGNLGGADDFSYLRGLPTRTVDLNYSSGAAIKTHIESRNYRTQWDMTIAPEAYTTHAYYNELLFIQSGNNRPVNVLKKYKVSSLWPRLEQTTDSSFNHHGQLLNTSTTESLYGNSQHKQVTQSISTLSDGNKRKTVFKYPQDYGGTLHAAYQSMIDSNMLSLPLETQSYYSKTGEPDKLTHASINTYKAAAGNTRKTLLLVPNKVFELALSPGNPLVPYSPVSVDAASSSYREKIHYSHYSILGKPEEIQWMQSQKTAYLWGYKGRHLIAEAVNATRANLDAALTAAGQSRASLLAETNEPALRGHLDNLAAQAPLNAAFVTLQTFHPVYGPVSLSSPLSGKQYYAHDKLGRLSVSRDVNGHITGHWRYRYTPDTQKNHIVSFTPRVASIDTLSLESGSVQRYGYFEGLGRATQNVGKGESPLLKDIVYDAVQFDSRKRPYKRYLPFPAGTSSGNFQADVQIPAAAFYTDLQPFSETTLYDNSTPGRELAVFGPGAAWRSENKAVQTYDAPGMARLYTANAAGNLSYVAYAAQKLVEKQRWDEQGHVVFEIYDSENKIVEKKSNGNSTAYIYDDAGRIKAVIQPEGYALNAGIAYDSEGFKKYVFFYEYDKHSRVIRKHIPGAGWTEIVYDREDRPVMTQDALQKTLNRWSFTQYDAFDREIIKGETTKPVTRTAAQEAFDAHVLSYGGSFVEQRPVIALLEGTSSLWTGPAVGFPAALEPTETEIRVEYVYDRYIDHYFKQSMAFHPLKTNGKGMLTAVVKYLHNPTHWNKTYLMDLYYYDEHNRRIQSHSTHQVSRAQNVDFIMTNYAYNFAGEVEKEYTEYTLNPTGYIYTKTHTERDHAGRVIQINYGQRQLPASTGGDPAPLIRYTHDEIGRLKQKIFLPDSSFGGGNPEYIYRPPNPASNTQDKARRAVILEPGTEIDAASFSTYLASIDSTVGSAATAGLQVQDYAWHIRGGLRGINLNAAGNPVPDSTQNDLFAYKLDYESEGQWSGNIGKQSWNHVNPQFKPTAVRSYLFGYDGSDRLKSAAYSGVGAEDYSLPNINYDKNGNITQLQRNGKTGGSATAPTFGQIDVLEYAYSGNRLTAVNDYVSGNHEVDFVNRNVGSDDYEYYANGALKKDLNEDIVNINYDTYLNQPIELNLSDGRWIKHTYDGSGELIKTEYSTGEYWEYGKGLIFKNGIPYQLNIPEGRAVFKSISVWEYEFDYKDHLGNTRVSFKDSLRQLKQTARSDFDPFLVPLKTGVNNSFQNRFEVQGHESEKTFGLNRINFGARVMNPTLGRFDRSDPLSELDLHLSNYSYVSNNPLKYIDLFGMKREKVKGEEDTYRETTPFDPVVVTGKRDKVNQVMGFDKYYQYLQYHSQDESFIKVKQSFREGGNMAAGMVMAPLAAIGAAELGAGSALAAGLTRLGALRTLSIGRATLRTALAKGAFNLGGQGISNALTGEMKLDLTGLTLDLIAPSKIAAFGGLGEAGFNFKSKSFYAEDNLNTKGLLKTGMGLGVGKLGDGLQNIVSANGFSKAMSSMGDAILKVYNEAANVMIDKLPVDSKK